MRVAAHKRFNKLWQLLGRLVPQQQLLARPLILSLDALDDPLPVVRMEASAWAVTSLRQVPCSHPSLSKHTGPCLLRPG